MLSIRSLHDVGVDFPLCRSSVINSLENSHLGRKFFHFFTVISETSALCSPGCRVIFVVVLSILEAYCGPGQVGGNRAKQLAVFNSDTARLWSQKPSVVVDALGEYRNAPGANH